MKSTKRARVEVAEAPEKTFRSLSGARVRRWVRETEKQLRAVLTESEWSDYQHFKQAAENRAKGRRPGAQGRRVSAG